MMKVNVPPTPVLFLDKSDVILHEGRPIVYLPKKLVGERLSTNMVATSSFVGFSEY